MQIPSKRQAIEARRPTQNKVKRKRIQHRLFHPLAKGIKSDLRTRLCILEITVNRIENGKNSRKSDFSLSKPI